MDDNLYDEFGNYIGPDLQEMGEKFSDDSDNEDEHTEERHNKEESDNIIPTTVLHL